MIIPNIIYIILCYFFRRPSYTFEADHKMCNIIWYFSVLYCIVNLVLYRDFYLFLYVSLPSAAGLLNKIVQVLTGHIDGS